MSISNRSAANTMAGLLQVRSQIAALTIEDGPPLSARERAFIKLGLAASVTSLNTPAIDSAIQEAFDAGATPGEIQEIVSVVSGLGVHSLMVTAPTILSSARRAGYDIDAPPTEIETAKWAARVGDDPFWSAMEREVPGFMRAMLRLSPAQFDAFFDYCAVPWKGGLVRAQVKELLAMASDATPAHLFMPGFRLHLANAIHLGAGRRAIAECIELAAQAPPHVGVA
jgi:alkylhydroperoxidase/carboxymuconolactone decarboxylase family protein YurZ